MSRENSTTGLIKPSPGNTPINSDAIHQLITNTNDKDMIFYEYEIVDREKEQKWARKQARKYGLCLCSRWLFLLVGNAILVALICSISAIILYVNTPIDLTYQPLSYGRSCSTGSNDCDSLRNLVCSSNLCSCYSNYAWNGTDCACGTQQYWDGLACLTRPGYQQYCSTSISCYTLFVCDTQTSSCLCSQYTAGSPGYYASYYTGGVTAYYTGTCLAKQTYLANCITYGVASCQEWLGLTCAIGPGNYLQCTCKTGYYWTGSTCAKLINDYITSCASNTVYACNSTAGLFCNGAFCRCDENYYYWDTTTSSCKIKGTIAATCSCPTFSTTNSQCNTTLNLACYVGSACSGGSNGNQYTTTACNCATYSTGVTTSTTGRCDCKSSAYYWDGQQCSLRVGLNFPCIAQYSCSFGTCQYGYCLV